MHDNHSYQLDCLWFTKCRRYCSTSWLIHSVCPSVWGVICHWQVSTTPVSLWRSFMNCATNWGVKDHGHWWLFEGDHVCSTHGHDRCGLFLEQSIPCSWGLLWSFLRTYPQSPGWHYSHGFWKFSYDVNGDVFPRGIWNLIGMQWVVSLSVMCLCTLAGFASFNVFPNVPLYSRPPIVPGDQFLGFILSWMSSSDTIMMFPDDVFLKFLVLWNTDSMFPCDCSFFIFAPIFLLSC